MGFGSGLVPRTLEAIFHALSEESMRWMILPSVLRRRFAILRHAQRIVSDWIVAQEPDTVCVASFYEAPLSAIAKPTRTCDARSAQVCRLQIHNERIRDLLAPATPKEAPAWQDQKPFENMPLATGRERERE